MSTDMLRYAVRNTREDLGLTQGDLARRAGVSRQWLAGLESGRMGNPRWASVAAVLDALGLQLAVERSATVATRMADDTRGVVAIQNGDERPYGSSNVGKSQVDAKANKSVAGLVNGGALQAVLDQNKSVAGLVNGGALQAVLDQNKSVAGLVNGGALQAVLDQNKSVAGLVNGGALQAVLDQNKSVAGMANDAALQAIKTLSGSAALKAVEEHNRQIARILNDPAIAAAIKGISRASRNGR